MLMQPISWRTWVRFPVSNPGEVDTKATISPQPDSERLVSDLRLHFPLLVESLGGKMCVVVSDLKVASPKIITGTVPRHATANIGEQSRNNNSIIGSMRLLSTVI